MDSKERKNIVKVIVEDAAKQMKDSIAPFPDSSAKSEFLNHIEKAKKENLRMLDELTKL
jgi:hypothetical protein